MIEKLRQEAQYNSIQNTEEKNKNNNTENRVKRIMKKQAEEDFPELDFPVFGPIQ